MSETETLSSGSLTMTLPSEPKITVDRLAESTLREDLSEERCTADQKIAEDAVEGAPKADTVAKEVSELGSAQDATEGAAENAAEDTAEADGACQRGRRWSKALSLFGKAAGAAAMLIVVVGMCQEDEQEEESTKDVVAHIRDWATGALDKAGDTVGDVGERLGFSKEPDEGSRPVKVSATSIENVTPLEFLRGQSV